MPSDEYTMMLTVADLTIIDKALVALPFSEVVGLIDKINKQIKSCQPTVQGNPQITM